MSALPLRPRLRPLRALVLAATCVAVLVGVETSQQAVSAQATLGSIDAPAAGSQVADRGHMRRDLPAPPRGLTPFPVQWEPTCYLWSESFGRTPSSSASGKHEGTDIMGVAHRPVYAVESGELYKRYANPGTVGSGYGWGLRGDSGVIYKYFHMTTDNAGWQQGDRVEVGHVIGYVGDTGTRPGNFHLHFEIRPDNVPTNPLYALDIPETCRIY